MIRPLKLTKLGSWSLKSHQNGFNSLAPFKIESESEHSGTDPCIDLETCLTSKDELLLKKCIGWLTLNTNLPVLLSDNSGVVFPVYNL